MIVQQRVYCRICYNIVFVVAAAVDDADLVAVDVVVDVLVAVAVLVAFVDAAAAPGVELEVVDFYRQDLVEQVGARMDWFELFAAAAGSRRKRGERVAKWSFLVLDPKIFPTIAQRGGWPICRYLLDMAEETRRAPPVALTPSSSPATQMVSPYPALHLLFHDFASS